MALLRLHMLPESWMAVAGTGLAQDKGTWSIMVVLIFASYWLKIRVEERLMMETFLERYCAALLKQLAETLRNPNQNTQSALPQDSEAARAKLGNFAASTNALIER